MDICIIKPEELEYEYPKKPIMETSTSQVYRGKYHGFQVAIKRVMDPANTSARSEATHSLAWSGLVLKELQVSSLLLHFLPSDVKKVHFLLRRALMICFVKLIITFWDNQLSFDIL